ncbi:hypothetical protein L1987_13319 [Smallanthus sonchifolius]|uniref:Uncharacterized protein n=1 Tax=Smallanthus sonchifolius TaxID=185202 RepID=A0ACB9JGR8_9ASTR|nr:hypothetical protein L1987_13319 [Smallanthus sonchifolius]
MWRSRRKSSREFDSSDGLLRRPCSKLNFIHSSFKDVENLFADDDTNGFNKTRAQSSPTARRLSIFHRVHLANKFARAFSTKQIQFPAKYPPESINLPAAAKSDRRISIPGAEKRVVVYMTSLRVVPRTFEACRDVQSILRGFRVSIDERDLSMDSRFLDELHNIMTEGGDDEKTKLSLPRVFIGGRYIGGAEEVKQLHETGELKKFVEGLPAVGSGVCEVCGDFRFILCDECSGSHKCYTEKGGFRSCTLCNENGLIRCPSCLGS